MYSTSRPHSAQATASVSTRRTSQEHVRESGEFQSYVSSSTRPTPTPPPPYASTNIPGPSQHGLLVSGIDQDEFSRPLLPSDHLSTLNSNIDATNRRTLQSQASDLEDFRGSQLDKRFSHAPDHQNASQNIDWQRSSYGTDRTRPTTAPMVMSERLAPDTTPFSQMLPPDRILPFPEKKNVSLRRPSERFEHCQQQPETRSDTSVKINPNTLQNRLTKTKTSKETSKQSTTISRSMTPTRATTPYNLRPGSSSSNVGIWKPATVHPTSSADTARPPTRDKGAESRTRLARGDWALSDAEFLQHFNKEAFSNITFVEELVKFAKIQKSFTAAKPLLLAAQRARRSRMPPGHKFREWISGDVKNAVNAQKESEQITASSLSRKANTPKKRTRAVSPISEDVRQEEQEPAQGLTASEKTAPTLGITSFNPTLPIATRKRPASALDEDSRDAETESGDSHSLRTPAPDQQASTAALGSQVQPTNGQADLAVTSEHQATSATLTLPVNATHPQSDLTNTADQSPSATTSISIQPTELLSVLDEWAKTSKLFSTRTVLSPNSKDLLAEYAAQDDETRVRSLDDMICECLEDANFVKLAQDVEAAWMRIGLGF